MLYLIIVLGIHLCLSIIAYVIILKDKHQRNMNRIMPEIEYRITLGLICIFFAEAIIISYTKDYFNK